MPEEIKFNPLVELGSTGLNRWGGYVSEEWLTELAGTKAAKVYREMSDNDPIIGAVLFAIRMLCRQVDWRVDPPDDSAEARDAARFLESCRGDMSESWQDLVSEALSMLVYGWAYCELVYKRRGGDSADPMRRSKYDDGRIGWRKIPIRAQTSLLEWVFNDAGELTAMTQSAPPDYKLRTIPVEKALLFRTETTKGNPEGRSILRNAYRCFSDDTEILTRAGWKRGLELEGDDEVATLNRATGELEYEKPLALNVYDYEGEMLRFKSRYVDTLVTPNHRLWARRAHLDNYEFIEARSVRKTASFKRDAGWSGVAVREHIVPEHEVRQQFRGGRVGVRETRPAIRIPMDVWLEFMGYFLSEGYTSSSGQAVVGICQKPGPKADAMLACMSRMPWNVYTHNKGKSKSTVMFEITDRQLWAHLRDTGRSPERRVPEYIKQLPSEQLRIFLRAYALGDGGLVGGRKCGEYGPYVGTIMLYTSSSGMADDLGELVLKAGGCPRLNWQESGFGRNGVWRVTCGKPTLRLRANRVSEQYRGKVWCPTTTNGVVYVRRDGKAAWSGNSWYFKKNIEVIEGIGVERDLAGLPVVWVPANVANPTTAAEVTVRDAYKNLATNIRRDEQEGILMPLVYDASGNKAYDLTLLSTGGTRQFATDTVINRYNTQIAASCLADFILLGSQKVGSFALASSKTHLFAVAIGAFLDEIQDVFNTDAIPRLFKLNDFKVKELPLLQHGDLEDTDLAELGAFISQLALAGAPLFPDETLEKHIRQVAHLPAKGTED